MRDKHLKGWIAAAKRKEREEAATEKEYLAEERKMEGTDGPGGEETAESKGGPPTEASNWDRVAELFQTALASWM